MPRYTRVNVRAFDRAGRALDFTAEDFHARVVQHECDHLDGFLYPMRMDDLSLLGFADEMRRAAAAEDEDEDMAEPETVEA